MANSSQKCQEAIPVLTQEPAYPLQFQNQPLVSKKPKEFPVRTLKIFGSVQIGLAVFLLALSIVGINLDVKVMEPDCDSYIGVNRPYLDWDSNLKCWGRKEYYPQMLAFDITCLILSGWYVLTGTLILCMSQKRENSWGGLKIGFMVCSIVGASLLAPAMFSLGGVRAFKRGEFDKEVDVLSVCIAVLSFAEMVVSIIAASYCCCCTPWKKINRVIYVQHQGMICTNPQFTIPMTTDQANLFYSVGQHGNPMIVQYPRAYQYQVIVTNPQAMPPAQFVETNYTVADNRQEKLVSTDPPAFNEWSL